MFTAVAAVGAERVPGEALGMHPDQGNGSLNVTLDQSDMLVALGIAIPDHPEYAMTGRQHRLDNTLYL
ncbi:hypothetical protein GCM10009582_27510 [Arthrobacter flavus]